MARERRPGDWEQDLAAARAEEARLADLLAAAHDGYALEIAHE
jgi:hypothetical protein